MAARDGVGSVARSTTWSVVLHAAAIAGACCAAGAWPARQPAAAVWVRIEEPEVPLTLEQPPAEDVVVEPPGEPGDVPVEIDPPSDVRFEPQAAEAGLQLLPPRPEPLPREWLRAVRPHPVAAVAARPEPPRPAVVVDARPQESANIPPRYPAAALRARQQGTVVIELQIGLTGVVLDAHVVESSGWRLLDDAALAQLRQWHFDPARRDGVPFVSWFRQPVEFHIVGS